MHIDAYVTAICYVPGGPGAYAYRIEHHQTLKKKDVYISERTTLRDLVYHAYQTINALHYQSSCKIRFHTDIPKLAHLVYDKDKHVCIEYAYNENEKLQQLYKLAYNAGD